MSTLFDPSGDEQNPYQVPSVAPQQTGGSVRDWDYQIGPLAVSIAALTTVINADSAEYVHAQVIALDTLTGAAQDPTGDTVSIALTQSGDPATGDWQAAEWITRTVGGVVTYWARVFVTAGSLTPGYWSLYVQIGDSPEVTVGMAGVLTVA